MTLGRTFSAIGSLVVLVMSTAPALGQCNPDATGNCDEVNGTPGCRVTECCDAVCEFDVLCCEESWDRTCIESAEKLCGGLTCPGLQPCTQAMDEPGCDDQSCCRLVCDHDWFCCWVEWDSQCVAFAGSICDIPPCEIGIPAGTPDEGELCYERLNDGCNRVDLAFGALGCGEAVTGTCTTDSPRDTDWYSIEIFWETTVTWNLRSEFPAQAVLVSGPCEGPLQSLVLAATTGCEEVLIEAVLEPGTYSLVIAPGMSRASLHDGMACDLEDPDNPPDPDDPPIEPSWFGLRYLLTATCDSNANPADIDGNGRVDGSDLLIVLSWWETDEPIADVDGSGVVDGADLLIVLGAWTG